MKEPGHAQNNLLFSGKGYPDQRQGISVTRNDELFKTERKVDTCIPARENMVIFQDAVQLAKDSGKWQKHPNKKRKDQEIQLVTDLGPLWRSEEPQKDVPVNACVVHDKKTGEYFVFMTTDTESTARQILNTYELRPEIEESGRRKSLRG